MYILKYFQKKKFKRLKRIEDEESDNDDDEEEKDDREAIANELFEGDDMVSFIHIKFYLAINCCINL